MKKIFRSLVASLLEKEAIAILKKYKPKVVGITGTVGKTSTKDAVYTALCRFVSVRKTKKSYNSEFGIPLTIIGATNPVSTTDMFAWLGVLLEGLKLILLPNHYPEWLVLEVGADHPGDIKRATRWLKPDIAIVTKLSKTPVHVEHFASPEDVFEEKGNLVRALKPGGTLILNAEDEDVLAYRNLSDEKTILFGNAAGSDLRSEHYKVVYDADGLPTGIYFDVATEEESIPVSLAGTLGEHHAFHVLAALAVTKALGENLALAAKNFRTHEPTPGRMRIIEGEKETVILDDTYNSSPVAAEEALKVLGMLEAKRKIAVLGDMLELGRYSVDAHRKAGAQASQVADILVTVGVRSRATAESALDNMNESDVFQFDDSREAGIFLEPLIEKGDAILVKGSQGMRMERIVEEMMAHPEDKEKLLVRQDEEWQRRG